MVNLGKSSAGSLYLFISHLSPFKKIANIFYLLHIIEAKGKLYMEKKYDFIIREGTMFSDEKHAIIFYTEKQFPSDLSHNFLS